MKRCIGILLLFAASLLVGFGCKRGSSSGPRPPVAVVKEQDFIHGQSSEEIIAKQKIKIVPKKAVPDNPEEARKQEQDIENERKAEEAKAAKQRRIEMGELGAGFMAFLRKTPPASQNDDTFLQYLRREKMTTLRKDVEERRIHMIWDVYLDLKSELILAYREGQEEDGGQMLVSNNMAVGTMKPADLKPRLLKQSVLVLWAYYGAFSQRVPADQRGLERFKQYLKENAPLDVYKMVEERRVMINPAADLRVGTMMLAAHSQSDPLLGHAAVLCSGATDFYPTDVVNANFKK